MTSHPPPTSYSSIFNPLSYTIEDGFLTLAEADNRYFKRTGGVVSGLTTFNAGLYSAAQINITANTDSSSTITGSLITAGGIGIAKTLYVGTGIDVNDGTVTNPAYSFATNTNTGLYLIGVNNLGISCNGINQVNISTSAITFTNPIRAADGTATNCGFGFSSSASSGMYYSGGVLRHMLGNTEMMKFQAAQIYSSRNHNFVNGTAGNPSICAQAFQTTGLFWAAGPIMGVATSGVQKFQYTTTQNISNQVLNMSNNNIINAPQVGNTAGNLELAVNSTGAGGTITLTGGTDLLQGTAGGSSGLHLKLIINGTVYKIALLNN